MRFWSRKCVVGISKRAVRVFEKMTIEHCAVGILTYQLGLITILITGALKIVCLFNNNASAAGELSPDPLPELHNMGGVYQGLGG